MAALSGTTLLITAREHEIIRRAEADSAVRDCGDVHNNWEMAVRKHMPPVGAFQVAMKVVREAGDPGYVEPKGVG